MEANVYLSSQVLCHKRDKLWVEKMIISFHLEYRHLV
jgi:hypothetical protein